METKIYEVKSPDGNIIKVQGPVGASQDEVIRQAQQLSSNQKAEQKRNYIQQHLSFQIQIQL